MGEQVPKFDRIPSAPFQFMTKNSVGDMETGHYKIADSMIRVAVFKYFYKYVSDGICEEDDLISSGWVGFLKGLDAYFDYFRGLKEGDTSLSDGSDDIHRELSSIFMSCEGNVVDTTFTDSNTRDFFNSLELKKGFRGTTLRSSFLFHFAYNEIRTYIGKCLRGRREFASDDSMLDGVNSSCSCMLSNGGLSHLMETMPLVVCDLKRLYTSSGRTSYLRRTLLYNLYKAICI